ncbi:hypothetical protein F5884DRAFT_731479 [Xylogone sp. PMI_703]|nr:hypothetical protein F5884DRAFT_731479 [Xylogone sp. PMI_703]
MIAHTPFTLIPIPHAREDITNMHSAIWVAREMACAHNCMLRCLNSIYHQCTFVKKPEDIKDMLTYMRFWYDWIHEHHDGEESIFFPMIEELSGEKGLMEANIAQHRAFEDGLEEVGRYAKETRLNHYDGVEVREMLDRVGPVLAQHLKDEIETLLALDKYDDKKVKKTWVEFDLAMRKGDKSILFPLVFGTHDNSIPGAGDWPEVPGFIRGVVHYWFERKHQSVWRFNPSTTWGVKRSLYFTDESA